VPKVHNKPIQVKRKGSNKRSKVKPKAALVWHTGLSGAPLGTLGGRSAIIHRTVRCSTGLSSMPAEQRLLRANSRLRSIKCATVCACARRSQSRRQKAHRTVYRTCPVHHRTIRWPHKSELQRSNPNGWVTWLAHRTVRCTLRQKPSPTTILVVGAINTPNHPTFMVSKFLAFKPLTRAITFNTRHKTKRSNPLPSPE
jgi:hypothetical protein